MTPNVKSSLDLYAELPAQPAEEEPAPAAGQALDLYDGVEQHPGNSSPSDTALPTTGALPEWMRSVWQTFPRDIRDRYEPGCVLGRGGMGIVLEALDRQMHRIVAIKGLRDPATAPLALKTRQAEEARITASLTHPNILPFFDLWQDALGNPWCSMLRVPGSAPTLAHRLDQIANHKVLEERPLAELLDIFLQICRAVAYAHDQRILHRDLKPDNIFLGPSGEALVADWGMATRLDGPVGPRERFVGTVGYAPPEQSGDPDAEQPSPASDIYSLGVILFELVVGRHHLALPTGMQESSPRASEERRELVVPARAPRELAAIIARATAWRTADRFGSVREMIRAIDAYLSGGVLEGFQYSFRERTTRWIRGHPAVTATLVSSVFFVALLAGRSAQESRAQALLLREATANLAQAFAEKASLELQNGLLDRSIAYAVLAVKTCAKLAQPPPPAACRLLAESGGVGWCVARRKLRRSAGALAFRPDSSLLLVGDEGGMLASLDFAADRPSDESPGHGAAVVAACFPPAPYPLVTLDRGGIAKFWKAPGFSEPATFPATATPLERVAYSSDGLLLAGLDTRGRVHVFSSDQTAVATVIGTPDFRARCMAFAPGKSQKQGRARLAVGGDDSTLRILDAHDGAELAALRHFAGPVNLVAFSPDGQILAACGSDQRILLWNLGSWTAGETLTTRGYPATALAIAPLGSLLAWGAQDGTIALADWRSGRILGRMEGHSDAILSLAWSADGRTLASSGADGGLCVWDTWRSGGADRLELPEDFKPPASLAFSANGESLAGGTGASSSTLQVWDRTTRLLSGTLPPGDPARASYVLRPSTTGPVVVLSPNGEWQVAGQADGSLVLTNARDSRRPPLKLAAHRSAVTAIAFSAKSDLFASAAEGGAIFLWRTPRGACLDLLASLEQKVLALAFSPDGRWLAASVEGSPVRLFDVTAFLSPEGVLGSFAGASLFEASGLDLQLAPGVEFTMFPAHHPMNAAMRDGRAAMTAGRRSK